MRRVIELEYKSDAWITYDPDDKGIRDVSFEHAKPVPVHSFLRVAKGLITFKVEKDA